MAGNFFRAQPYAWRKPELDEVTRHKMGQTSLMGDVFSAIGQVGEQYILGREEARQREVELARRAEIDVRAGEMHDIDVAEGIKRMGGVHPDTPIARSIRDPIGVGFTGGLPSLQFGEERRATAGDVADRRILLTPEDQLGAEYAEDMSGINIPPGYATRFNVGEEDYVSLPHDASEIAAADPARMKREAEAREASAVLWYDFAISNGSSPEEAEAFATLARSGDLKPTDVVRRTADIEEEREEELDEERERQVRNLVGRTAVENPDVSTSEIVQLVEAAPETRGVLNFEEVDEIVRSVRKPPPVDATVEATVEEALEEELEERRKAIIQQIGRQPATEFEQQIVDDLAEGKTKAQILTEIRAAGVSEQMIEAAGYFMGRVTSESLQGATE